MSQYETVVIVDAMIPDESIESEFEAVSALIAQKGVIKRVDKWGKKRMAYEIKGRSHGEYAVFYYESDSGITAELDRRFRINENILRWVTVEGLPMPPAPVPPSMPGEPSRPEAKPATTAEGGAS